MALMVAHHQLGSILLLCCARGQSLEQRARLIVMTQICLHGREARGGLPMAVVVVLRGPVPWSADGGVLPAARMTCTHLLEASRRLALKLQSR